MRQTLLILLLFAVSLKAAGQQASGNITGKVSFISTRNIYVKFNSTEGITSGDTLYIPSSNDLIPALVVKNLSSTSCICILIADVVVSTDHLVIAKKRPSVNTPEEIKMPIEEKLVPAVTENFDSTATVSPHKTKKQLIKGSLSVNSYSDFTNTVAGNAQRFRYTLSVNARNIAESGFSLETYISFKHKAGDWGQVKSDIFNALKIYSLSATYDLNPSTHFALGRKINSRISNIGSIDGLQAEKTLGRFTLGLIAGTRPDYADYGFNPDLFQFGGYASLDIRTASGYSGTSLAFMQQTNKWKTDRRFLYFQHSSSFLKNLNFLGTFEIDLYKLENEVPKSTFNLTSAFMSLRYRITKRLSLSGTYDARKNVMYYETYKTYLDRILDNETLQGFRIEASSNISEKIILGLQSGYRYAKSDPRPSENIRGYFTYSRIPGINMSASLSGTWLRSGYADGIIGSIYFNGDYIDGKVQTGIGYNFTNYTIPENNLKIIQNTAELSLSLNINRYLSFSINYEGILEKQDIYHRIYLQARIRF